MREIAEWLESLGLSEYMQCFAGNHIDTSILGDLSDQDLEEIGVKSLGHRRKLLRAIAEFRGDAASAKFTHLASQKLAERRQLTLMFCDLVGSTALSVRLDPEELREIINGYHNQCTQVITGFGGFIARYMGDGVLAYFGYPHAHEHDAERAVQSALALIDVLANGNAMSRQQVRIGIATGSVIVGDIIGAGAAQEETAFGETPNLASRLQAVAEPNTIVIDVNTRRLLGGLFEHRALGNIFLEGFAHPVSAWQVMGASSVDSRFEALRAATTPVVGRSEEIDQLMYRWERAKAGDGCVVLISGEAGIGKSRVAQTILERVSGDAYIQLRYFCSPHHQDTALYPVITHLERSAGFRGEDTAEQRLDKLEGILADAAIDVSGDFPLFAALLSIKTDDRYPPLNLSPQQQKDKTLKALLGQVERLAKRKPVLIVVEDAHWSDPTSQELFDLLVDRVPRLPILVIITFRPEFVPPWLGRSQVTLLSLNRLSPRRQAEIIEFVTDKALPKEIVEQIVDRADGVPLFIEELTKALLESGVLSDVGDRYTITGPLPPLAIPTTLNASLLARLDRLAPVREVAQIGAALGRRFSHELISAVAEMPQQHLNNALSQLASSELIFRHGNPPDAEYSFKHALVQDAAYSTLLRSRRQQLHGRIAAVLESSFPDVVEFHPELMARHCAEAGLPQKASEYWLKAGQQAIAKWALVEAIAQLRKGLDLVSGLPDSAVRQEHELILQMMLGRALAAAKGYAAAEAGEAFSRARQLCERLNRPAQLARALGGQFAFRLVRAELEQAEYHAEEMRKLGEAFDTARWMAAGSAASGCVCCYLGKFDESRAHYENWLSLWDPTRHAFGSTPEDHYVQGLIHLSRTLLCLGYVDQARSRRAEAIAEARRLSPYTLVSALCLAWYVDWALEGARSAHTILQSSEEVITLSEEQGFPLWFAVGNIMRGWSLGAVGKAEAGIPIIIRGLSLRTPDAKLLDPFYLVILAELYGIASRPKEGLERLAEAVALTERTEERWIEAEIYRLRGRLSESSNEQQFVAESSYRQAIAIAQRQNAKFFELRAVLDLARLWRVHGKRSEARDLLSSVLEWFAQNVDATDVKEATILLNELN